MSGPTETEVVPGPDEEGQEAAPERQTTPFLVLQFFIFPMAIVVVCVAVFAVFGLIASEGKSPRDHLNEVRSGGGLFNHKRWQAAFALAGAIEFQRESARSDPRFARELTALFEESARWQDPLARRYLGLALGRLGDPVAVPALRRAAGDDLEADIETRLYAILALGRLGDPAALPELLSAVAASDPGLRKAAVHALGSFPDRPLARQAMRAALEDAVDDVRWNAALGLARMRDTAALPVLARMLDRKHVEEVPSITPEQADAAIEQAITAAAHLGTQELRPALEHIRDHDPRLRLRSTAGAALERGPD